MLTAWNVLDAHASYCCMRSSIRTNMGGAAKSLEEMFGVDGAQAFYGPYALPRVVHRRIGGIAQVQTRWPTFRFQCWSSDFVSVSDLLANAMGPLACSSAAPSPLCEA